MSEASQRLDLRNAQNLVMTPQLQQAIKLLQLNNVELTELIEDELANNPLLEKVDEDKSDETSDSPKEEHSKDFLEDSFDTAWTGNENDLSSQKGDFDPGSKMASASGGGSTGFEDNDYESENRLNTPLTLRAHLLEQLNVSFIDARDLMIGGLLIDQLDDNGYLRIDQVELSQRLSCSEERLASILSVLKQFEPTGVFARDLQECLALQLEEQGRLDKPMRTLLKNLDLLGRYEFSELEKKCDVNSTYLQDMISEIKELNPKPASTYEPLIVQTAIPDVLMKKLPNNLGGGWGVELNTDTLPRILVNQSYYTEVAKSVKDKKEKAYLDQNLQSANWLLKAMDQRAKTILKVSSEIIEEQNAFFLYGIEFLRPLTLKDIAEKINMHESTVSRVTNNKYIGTPRGLFELKYFFSTALGGLEGSDSHSSETVKARIKYLIDNESSNAILSDDKIVKILKNENIDIARRTVAKYRETMNISSSVQRRREKNR